MTDKERILPRLSSAEIEAIIDPPIGHSYRIQLGRLGMEHLEQVAFAQRDADWKRIEPLLEACQAFRMALDKYDLRPRIRWVAWCWKRPVWLGAPLGLLVVLPLMLLDLGIVTAYVLSHWGKKLT